MDLHESARLAQAVVRNCTCDTDNPAQPPCGAHAMLTDNNLLNHLEFIRRIHEKVERSEWLVRRERRSA